jgi:hypothetical protein
VFSIGLIELFIIAAIFFALAATVAIALFLNQKPK